MHVEGLIPPHTLQKKRDKKEFRFVRVSRLQEIEIENGMEWNGMK